MNFTREPIIETIITPRDGCKLVLRNSKALGQEEYFVEAIEVVSFGGALFFRSTERPKPFLLPVTDYEVLEVRETRMVLKHVGVERAIKIGGGRDTLAKQSKSRATEKKAKASVDKSSNQEPIPANTDEAAPDKRRDRRRRRRRRDELVEPSAEGSKKSESEEALPAKANEKLAGRHKKAKGNKKDDKAHKENSDSAESKGPSWPRPELLLAPPPNLISDSIDRYKEMQGIPIESDVKEKSELKEESPVVDEVLENVAKPVEKPKKRGPRKKADKKEEKPSEAVTQDTDSSKKRTFASWLFPYGSEVATDASSEEISEAPEEPDKG